MKTYVSKKVPTNWVWTIHTKPEPVFFPIEKEANDQPNSVA